MLLLLDQVQCGTVHLVRRLLVEREEVRGPRVFVWDVPGRGWGLLQSEGRPPGVLGGDLVGTLAMEALLIRQEITMGFIIFALIGK